MHSSALFLFNSAILGPFQRVCCTTLQWSIHIAQCQSVSWSCHIFCPTDVIFAVRCWSPRGIVSAYWLWQLSVIWTFFV